MKKLFLINLKVVGVFVGVCLLFGLIGFVQKYFNLDWLFGFINEKSKLTMEKAPWLFVGAMALSPLVIAAAKKSRKEESRLTKWLRQLSRWMASSSAFILSGMSGALVGYGLSSKFVYDSINSGYVSAGAFGLFMAVFVYTFAFKISEELRKTVSELSGTEKLLARSCAVVFSLGVVGIALFDIYGKQIA